MTFTATYAIFPRARVDFPGAQIALPAPHVGRDLESGDHNNVSGDRAIETGYRRSMSGEPIVLTRASGSLCPDVASLSANFHHVSSNLGSLLRSADDEGLWRRALVYRFAADDGHDDLRFANGLGSDPR
jgi:hypothetical protein